MGRLKAMPARRGEELGLSGLLGCLMKNREGECPAHVAQPANSSSRAGLQACSLDSQARAALISSL